MATAEAISFLRRHAGVRRCRRHTYTMDPALLERRDHAANQRVIPVHLYGQLADMDPIMEIANRTDSA